MDSGGGAALGDFLIGNAATLSGRIVLLEIGKRCCVDVERKDLSVKHFNCEVTEVYCALLMLCKKIDAHSMKYVTELGDTDKVKCLGMRTELYLTSYDAAILILPMSVVSMQPAGEAHGAVAASAKSSDPALMTHITNHFFKRAPDDKKWFFVLHTKSVDEFRSVTAATAPPYFTASSETLSQVVAVEYETGKKVPCARCKRNFSRDEKGCHHVPLARHNGTLHVQVKYTDEDAEVDTKQRLTVAAALTAYNNGQYHNFQRIEYECGHCAPSSAGVIMQ